MNKSEIENENEIDRRESFINRQYDRIKELELDLSFKSGIINAQEGLINATGKENYREFRQNRVLMFILLFLSSLFIFYVVYTSTNKSEIGGTTTNPLQQEVDFYKEKLRISKLETDFYRDEFINCNK
jgi:hypothetical protein